MPEIVIKMVDHDRCLICGGYIGKLHDPALCDDERCRASYDFECSFNRLAREEMDEPCVSIKP